MRFLKLKEKIRSVVVTIIKNKIVVPDYATEKYCSHYYKE